MEARRESDREKRGGGGATAATVALPLPRYHRLATASASASSGLKPLEPAPRNRDRGMGRWAAPGVRSSSLASDPWPEILPSCAPCCQRAGGRALAKVNSGRPGVLLLTCDLAALALIVALPSCRRP